MTRVATNASTGTTKAIKAKDSTKRSV
jgi:hypothetical protein